MATIQILETRGLREANIDLLNATLGVGDFDHPDDMFLQPRDNHEVFVFNCIIHEIQL